MKVLFLDIDGVLNGHEWDDEAKSCNIRRECVRRLNRVVRETGCKVVLSSAWRYIVLGGDMTLRGFGYMLRTHGLTAEGGTMNLIVGHTEADADPPGADGERAGQVRKWLDEWNGPFHSHPKATTYAVVDDDDDGFTAAGMPCVITDGGRGLTDADADRLIALLNGEGGDS